jgi:hypothetical protein
MKQGDMGKIKNRTLVHLNEDIVKNEELKATISKLDDNVQKMLLWTTISSVGSYLVFIMVIIRIYSSLNGKHLLLLAGSLFLIYILTGILIFFVWKGIKRTRSHFHVPSPGYLTYQITMLFYQRKLISCYLLEYASLLTVVGISFYLDFQHGLVLLFKLTAPVSFITYVLGFYFIGVFTRKMERLRLRKRQINQAFVENISQN